MYDVSSGYHVIVALGIAALAFMALWVLISKG